MWAGLTEGVELIGVGFGSMLVFNAGGRSLWIEVGIKGPGLSACLSEGWGVGVEALFNGQALLVLGPTWRDGGVGLMRHGLGGRGGA